MKFKKGSAAAKAYMAKLRAAKGKTKKVSGLEKVTRKGKKTTVTYSRVSGVKSKKTYDVYFNNDEHSNNKGFEYTLAEAKNYIKHYNGTNESYFKDYKGGLVQIIDNDTGNVVYSTKIKSSKKISGIKKSPARSLHKDTKSHNVNIRVMSGLDKVTRKGKKTTVSYSRISGMPQYKDPDMARELYLYSTNDSQLYYQQRRPILINLSKKYKKGTFDVDKAAKLWRYFVDNSLQKYNKEFGSKGDKWFELMSVHDRNLLAHEFAEDTKAEFDLGNFTEK
jgi:hypothetical protein